MEHALIASRAYTNAAVVRQVLAGNPRRVLDAGCGEGWLVRALAGSGIDAWGVDASAPLIDAAKQHGQGRFLTAGYQAIVDDPSLLQGPYDTVVFNFSLLDDQAAHVLRAVATRLTAPGRILVQTLHPNGAGGGEYADGWRVETFTGLANGAWQPMPWYFRTFQGWMEVFREAGCAIEHLIEPRDPSGKVLSVLFELRLS